MEITSVKIQTVAATSDFRAYADITFDDCFRVFGLRLFLTPNGYELFMPSKKMSRGEWVKLAYSITTEIKTRIEAAVIAEYEKFRGEKLSSQTPVKALGETRHEIQQRK